VNCQHRHAFAPRFKRQLLSQRIIMGWGASLTAAALIPAGGAFAQTAAAPAAQAASAPTQDGLQSVYVTARKRAELEIDVPISIQTLSDKELRASGTTSVADLQTQAGFSFTSAQSTGAYGRAAGMVVFRGLQGELGRPSDASGGVFIDGVAITGGISTLNMTDVARVEVLKGPQNAFFGRSTFGGAVNFITKNPSATGGVRGSINTSINQRGSSDTDLSVESPLVQGILSGRVFASNHDKAAEYHATDGGALGAETSKTLGGTLYFTPTERLWARARASYQLNDDSLPAVAYLAATGNTSCSGAVYTGIGRNGEKVQYTPGTAYFCGDIPSLKEAGPGVINANTAIPAAAYNAFVNNSLGSHYLAQSPRLDHSGMRSEVKQASLQMGYALPKDMDLAFNVGYNEANTTSIFDLDKTGTPNFYTEQITPTHDLTVDARLSSDQSQALRGVVGASKFKSSYIYTQIDYSPGVGGTAAAINAYNFSNFQSSVPALYGSVEYDLTKQITASVEARYQKDKIASYTAAGVALNNETSNWLPRMTLRYKPTANTSTYFNFAEGVQPLTVNSGYTSASAAAKAFILENVPGASDFTKQPKLTSFEIGLKQRVGKDWQYALAFYDMYWKNRLTTTSLFNPVSCGTTTGTAACPLSGSGVSIQDGNDARIKGIELSVDGLVTPAWAVGAYVDYKNATWAKYNSSSNSVYGSYGALGLTGSAVAFNGNSVARVPKFQFSANSTYRFGALNGWKPYVRGDVTYVGGMFESDYNFAKTDGYSRIDLRAGSDNGGVSFDVFVKNLANNRGWTTVSRVNNLGITPLTSYANQGLTAMAQEARTFGVRASYAF